jgi:hypothetical protein
MTKQPPKITRGLVIREPWASLVVDGKKTWEMRTRSTQLRGPIAIIAGGSGTIIGTAELADVKGPLSRAQVAFNTARHRIPPAEVESGAVDNWHTAWVMKNARRLDKPLPYNHPSGAVIWVALDEATQEKLEKSLTAPARKKQPQPRR